MPSDNAFTHEQLRIAKQATDLGVWIWNIESDELSWDERTAELFGFFPEGGVDDFFQTVHPNDLDRVKTAVNHSVETGDPYELRYRIRNEASVRWIEAHGEVLDGSDHEQKHMIGSVKDVTQEMSHQRELEFFRKAMNQNPDELYLVEPDSGRILDVSESVEDMLGYTREELISMHVRDINPRIGNDVDWKQHVHTLKQEGPQTIETRHRRKDGSTFPVEVHVGYAEFEGQARLVATGRDISQRRKTEQERTHFQHVVEASGHGVLITDPDGTITYVNPAIEEMSGYDRSELIDRTPRMLKSGEHDDAFYRALWDTITSGDIWRGEMINRRKSGDLYHAQQTISPVTDASGKLEAFIAVQEDVTDQKQHEQELRLKNRAMDHSPIGIVLTDAAEEDNPICYANEGFLRVTGYDRADVIGRNCRFLQGEDTDPDVVQQLRGAIDASEPVEVDIRNYRADGEMFWNHLLITPIRNEAGDVTHFIGYQQDITARKEIEASLRKREKLYRTLFEEANEGFLIESMDDVILEANQAACELLGYTTEDLEGMPLARVTPPETQEECGEQGIVEYHLDKHGSSLFHWEYLSKDSTRVPVEENKTPIRYEGTDAVLVCIRDRSKLERMRKQDERKSSFVSQVTHDLRTPLNSITGMSGLLMDTDLSGKQQNYLQTILNASRNMERLTNDILDLNRIERGELILNEEPFNLERLLGEVISLYSQELQTQEITMSTEVAEGVPDQLIGDPDRLKRILHNLVDNAIKHTREGSIQIRVAPQGAADETFVLSFSVSDTGEGIPESELDEVFKEHTQVDAARGGSELGLGLGLSICHNLVELMNGHIEVESEVGEGTTFTFTVELKQAEAKPETGAVDLSDVMVLLVEDNEHVRNVLRTYLDAHGVNTTEADSGETALDELMEHPSTYDVVFLDRHLGDMQGEELLRKLTEHPEAIDPVRVFIISGDPAEQVRELIEPMSCGGVMEKPIDESDLVNAISSVVRKQNEPLDDKDTEYLQDDLRNRSPDPFHVLIADDDQNTRTYLEELLTPVADQLTFVTNGQEAMDRRFDTHPDLILMDLEMPQMDGLAATALIREEEQVRNLAPIPIICQTARAMKHVETKCLQAGANHFLRKPIKRRRLYRSMLEVYMDGEPA